MGNSYPHLFSPLSVEKVTFRNRILAAPGSPCLDYPGTTAFYENKARGGAACVTFGEHAVTSKYPVEPPGLTFVLDGDEQDVRDMGCAVRAVKSYGALCNIQLNHHGEYYRYGGIPGFGVYSAVPPIGPTARCGGLAPLDPTAGKNWEGLQVVEMDEEMIEEAIEAFADAALVCKRAGFDMVQVHGAHGWLLPQFVSPYFNKRTDRWGGSLENRARFPMAVLV